MHNETLITSLVDQLDKVIWYRVTMYVSGMLRLCNHEIKTVDKF